MCRFLGNISHSNSSHVLNGPTMKNQVWDLHTSSISCWTYGKTCWILVIVVSIFWDRPTWSRFATLQTIHLILILVKHLPCPCRAPALRSLTTHPPSSGLLTFSSPPYTQIIPAQPQPVLRFLGSFFDFSNPFGGSGGV